MCKVALYAARQCRRSLICSAKSVSRAWPSRSRVHRNGSHVPRRGRCAPATRGSVDCVSALCRDPAGFEPPPSSRISLEILTKTGERRTESPEHLTIPPASVAGTAAALQLRAGELLPAQLCQRLFLPAAASCCSPRLARSLALCPPFSRRFPSRSPEVSLEQSLFDNRTAKKQSVRTSLP